MQRTFIATAIGAVAVTIVGCMGEVGGVPSSGESASSGSVKNNDASGTSSGNTVAAQGFNGGNPGTGGPGSGAMVTNAGGRKGGLPCDIEQLLTTRCQSCHGAPPLPPSPMSLVTVADLLKPSLTDATKSYAQQSVVRMRATVIPMPPAPATHATAAEIAVLQNWITAGYPTGSCGGLSVDTGALRDGGAAVPPASVYNTPTLCTSKTNWMGGNNQAMRPGEACIACHSRGEGPQYAIAGTVYPTAHEPNDCNGTSGTAGATVVVIDKSGAITTLTPDAAGNFSFGGSLATPYQAKVVQAGKERVMVTAQTVGDCNLCHTETGANSAPGRIMLP